MFISPLAELIAAIAILASALHPLINDYIDDRTRAVVTQVASELSASAHKATDWCHANADSCTGISWANLAAEKFISAAQQAEFTADMSVAPATDRDGGTDAFKITSKTIFAASDLDGYRDSTGIVPTAGADTGTRICISSDNGGVYRTASGTTC